MVEALKPPRKTKSERVADQNPEETKCIPYVSTYSDCTEDNLCDGCQKCTCDVYSQWTCEDIRQCTEEQQQEIEQANIDSALNYLIFDTKKRDENGQRKYVPDAPTNFEYKRLLEKHAKIKIDDPFEDVKIENELMSLLNRWKRSVDTDKANGEEDNGTVVFHHTIDELNEDTLRNTNKTGTISASKVDMIASRRSTLLTNTTSQALQIEYTPPMNSQHAGDNKVDSAAIHDDQEDLLVHHKMYEAVGNQSQATRDKVLSKLVVNELKGGAETIGDKNTPIISNITFTSENDTLTAMVFIAGNLLSKLWNMEKDESDDSLEAEHLKHTKINDLLELFKEPLNLRQEQFLKNALKQLSKAIENKNLGNMSLCKNFEELKDMSDSKIESDKESTKQTSNEEKATTAAALSKVNNVLDLIQKYERVQNSLNAFNKKPNLKTTVITSPLDKGVTKDEKASLNLFGNILETVMKVLLPNKKGKKMAKRLKNKPIFASDKNIEETLKKLNLTGMTITAKDRIVLDYLAHIQNSPSCLFNKQQEKPKIPSIEGDILLNLSEFFKIKSMSDLLKLVDSKNQKDKLSSSTIKTTPLTIEKSSEDFTTETNVRTIEKENTSQFEATKEKLKTHLKTILEDLIELQNVNGKSTTRKNIEISEALPCIYNLLNPKINLNKTVKTNTQEKQMTLKKEIQTPANKITEILENLRKAMTYTTETRRTSTKPSGPRPKSAIIWERTINNLVNKHKLNFRRNMGDEEPKPIEDVKTIIDRIESLEPNMFKSVAYRDGVSPAERLILLKSLNIDTKRYIKALEDIQLHINTVPKLPVDRHDTIAEFVDNVDRNLNLSGKVLQNINKPKKNMNLLNENVERQMKINTEVKEFEIAPSRHSTVKLTRDQILNQLIKNRMLYYLRMSDEAGNTKSNINMSLAKKILLYLEIGNDNLARQLYKIFVTENKNRAVSASSSLPDSGNYESLQQKMDRKVEYKVPLIQFEEPKPVKENVWLNQDQLIRQLMNIKNLKI